MSTVRKNQKSKWSYGEILKKHPLMLIAPSVVALIAGTYCALEKTVIEPLKTALQRSEADLSARDKLLENQELIQKKQADWVAEQPKVVNDKNSFLADAVNAHKSETDLQKKLIAGYENEIEQQKRRLLLFEMENEKHEARLKALDLEKDTLVKENTETKFLLKQQSRDELILQLAKDLGSRKRELEYRISNLQGDLIGARSAAASYKAAPIIRLPSVRGFLMTAVHEPRALLYRRPPVRVIAAEAEARSKELEKQLVWMQQQHEILDTEWRKLMFEAAGVAQKNGLHESSNYVVNAEPSNEHGPGFPPELRPLSIQEGILVK